MSQIIDLREVRQREGKRFKSKKHLAFVAEKGCAVCGHRPVQVHHLLHFTGGTKRALGKKAGDNYTVALCQNHHIDAHKSPQSYEAKWGLGATAKHLWETSPANEEREMSEWKAVLKNPIQNRIYTTNVRAETMYEALAIGREEAAEKLGVPEGALLTVSCEEYEG